MNQTRTRPGMLYGHRNIAMLYGGPCLNLIYISALPHRGNWGWGRMSGGERGTEKREERYLFVFYWLRRSRFQISHRAECSKHRRSFLCRFIYNPARRILLIDRSRPFRKFHETIFSKYSQPLVKRAFSRKRKGRRERERERRMAVREVIANSNDLFTLGLYPVSVSVRVYATKRV